MKKVFSFIILLLICNFALAQQIVVGARVVDANTGDILPFTAIQSSRTGAGTITNYDGDFSMRVDSDDELIISFIGYEKLTIKACDMPNVISLTPWDINLPEVTVTSGEGILINASKQLDKELKKYGKNRSQYFMRMNILRTDAGEPIKKDSTGSADPNYDKQRYEIAEAFITACSMGNLRDAEVVKGLYGRKTSKGLETAKTSSLDFHHVLEAGPWIEESEYWAYVTLPLSMNNNLIFLRHTYDIKVQMKQDKSGTNYYIINLKRKDENYYPRGIITGKLYLNANTLQPLRFEGKVEDLLLSLRRFGIRELYGLNISVNVTFKHNKGYTEVANMSCTMSSNILDTKAILFNVDDIDLKTGELIAKDTKTGKKSKYKMPSGKSLKANMLESIRKAGFKKELWENSNIVKRTNEEQQVFGLEADASDDFAHIIKKESAENNSTTPDLSVTPITPNLNRLLYRISGNGLQNNSFIIGSCALAEGDSINKITDCNKIVEWVDQVCAASVLISSQPLESQPSDNSKSTKKQDTFKKLPAGKTLRSVMKGEDFRKVKAYAQKTWFKDIKDYENTSLYADFIKMTPATVLSAFRGMKMMKQNIDQDKMVGKYIQQVAATSKKKIFGLQDKIELQLTADDDNMEKQVAALLAFIDNEVNGIDDTQMFLDAYYDQDVNRLYKLATANKSPEELEKSLFSVNENWLNSMPAIMFEGSTLFVVDAIQLCGERGILKGLQDLGYDVVGVNK